MAIPRTPIDEKYICELENDVLENIKMYYAQYNMPLSLQEIMRKWGTRITKVMSHSNYFRILREQGKIHMVLSPTNKTYIFPASSQSSIEQMTMEIINYEETRGLKRKKAYKY